MTRVLPFTIGNMTFRHTEGDRRLDEKARERWRHLSDAATFYWRREDWERCPEGKQPNETSMAFAVFKDDKFFGTWALYRIRPAGGTPYTVSALPGPMFDDIKGGRAFWRRMFMIMEWMLDNPMPMTNGHDFVVDHWRFPSREDGDPVQHEWVGVEKHFIQHAGKEFEIDRRRPERPIPKRMNKRRRGAPLRGGGQ